MSPSSNLPEAALAAGTKATVVMTQGGAGLTILGGMTLNEFAIIIGAIVSVVGLLGNWAIQWYWKSKSHQLKVDQLEWDRRQRDMAVPFDRRRNGGRARPSVVAAMLAAGTLALASPALMNFLERWESRENVAYADKLTRGLPTVCAGITNHTSPVLVAVGDYWSDEQCEQVERLVVGGTQMKLADCLHVRVSQQTFDALSSHAHNFGVPSTCASRAVGLINAGRLLEGCDALAHANDGKTPVWSYVTDSGGKKRFIRGLYNRRLAERDMCLSGTI